MVRDPLISVIGWYGKGNVGDESYKLSFPALFEGKQFVFGDGPAAGSRAAVLGGGDVVTTENLARLRRSSGRKYLMSVAISQALPKDQYEGIELALVRDQISLDRIKESGVRAILCPDFAFSLTPNKSRGKAFISTAFHADNLDLYERKVAVIINSHLTFSTTARESAVFEKFTYDMVEVADNTNASFVFIPFGSRFPWDDRMTNSWIAGKCKYWKKNCVVYEALSPQTALDVISAADAVISTRLHSSIFATVAGVPFVDVTHNHKNPNYLKATGLTDWSIPLKSFSAEDCMALLHSHLEEPYARETVGDVGREQQSLLKQVVKDVRLG